MSVPASRASEMQQTLGNQATQQRAAACPAFSKCPTGGACHACPFRVRAKLIVGRTDDVYEREADHVANEIITVSNPESIVVARESTAQDIPIQRLGGSLDVLPEIEETLRVQRGEPLSDSVRAFFEQRFCRDFSNVRVHTNTHAGQAADMVNAQAFTIGRDIFFGTDRYTPLTTEGSRLLAHELTHVIQQTNHNDTPPMQRRVRDTNVSCLTTGLHGGVPAGNISGPEAIAAIRNADARAIELARRAENLLFLQRLTAGTAGYVADPDFDLALANRFGLNVTNPAHQRRIEILQREFRAVAGFLESGAVYYVCRDAGCKSDRWAFTYFGQHTIRLCNPFWNAGSLNLQGSTLLHEAMHLWWSQVDDQGHPPMHNAHCFEQFALDLAGATAEIPADFVGACAV